jgi:hypothetical protein
MRVRYNGESAQVVNTAGSLVCIMLNDGITFWLPASDVQ